MPSYLELVDETLKDVFKGIPEVSDLLTDNVKDMLRNDTLETIKNQDNAANVVSFMEDWKENVSSDFDLMICVAGMERLLVIFNVRLNGMSADGALEIAISLSEKYDTLRMIMRHFDSNQGDIFDQCCLLFYAIVRALEFDAEALTPEIKQSLISTSVEAAIGAIRNQRKVGSATLCLYKLLKATRGDETACAKFRNVFMMLGGVALLFDLLERYPTYWNIVVCWSAYVVQDILRVISVETMELPLADLTRWRVVAGVTEARCVEAHAEMEAEILRVMEPLKESLDLCLEATRVVSG